MLQFFGSVENGAISANSYDIIYLDVGTENKALGLWRDG